MVIPVLWEDADKGVEKESCGGISSPAALSNPHPGLLPKGEGIHLLSFGANDI